jgi:hypothetical protein
MLKRTESGFGSLCFSNFLSLEGGSITYNRIGQALEIGSFHRAPLEFYIS